MQESHTALVGAMKEASAILIDRRRRGAKREIHRQEGRKGEREREKGQTKRPKRAFVSAVAAAGRMIARASLCIIEIDIDTNFFSVFCLLCVQCETLTKSYQLHSRHYPWKFTTKGMLFNR